jgi:nitrogen fixation protein NifU and related proteins
MDKDLKREIILDNYQNPYNKGLNDTEGYIKINSQNESCIDNIILMIKIEDNLIKDIRFDGEACAISTSSTSIMIKLLINKTIEEALNIIENYENMINEKEYNKDILEEALVYDEIYKQPNRIKCATLPYRGIKKVLIDQRKN